jgi:SAM-dependent methyltransferase
MMQQTRGGSSRRWAVLRGAAHRFVQGVLAPGGTRMIETRLRAALDPTMSDSTPWLDVGAGSRSRLAALGRQPVVVDISLDHASAAHANGALAVVASVEALPFADGLFGVTACVGLLHHLPDHIAHTGLRELARVTTPNGRVVVFDAVLPDRPWRRPVAALIRALDRGQWMRRQPALASLLRADDGWSVERLTYAGTGLEGVFATRGGSPPCP